MGGYLVIRRHALATAAGVALLAASTMPAFAQDKPAGAPPQPKTGPQADFGDDIIVTAQRRSENVQDVPVTVSVVTQKQLDVQNITTTTDLTRAVPALTATDEGIFQVRGIGTQGFGRSAEQSVSVVLDGVVLGRALTNSMYDLDNVEVLSGPQGTLFGKNANAGVINVVTHAPVLNDYQAIGHLDIGNQDYVHGYVIGNLPIGNNAALRISYHHDQTGRNVYNTLFKEWDRNTDDGVRGRLLWKPTESLTINLSGDYQHLASNGVNGVADFAGVGVYSSAPKGSLLEATLAGCGIVASPRNNRVCANSLRLPGVKLGDTYGRRNFGGSLTIDYTFASDLTFTSITAFRKTTNEEFGIDADVAGEFADTLPANYLDRNLVPYVATTWSEEARIASSASKPLSFVAGVYFDATDTRDEIDQTGTFGIPLGGLEFRRQPTFRIHQRDYAAFGQIDWRITPNLKIFVGGRVTHNDLSDFSINSFANPNGVYLYTGDTGFFSVLPVNSCTLAGGVPYDAVQIPCPAGTSVNEPARLKKTGFSGTAGIQYRFSPNTMIFARYARGYKGPFLNESVTYNAGLARQPLAIDSEFVDSVDLGIKTKVFNRLSLSVSLFDSKINGFQTTVYVPPIPPQIVANFIQGNAKYAITRGVEVSFFGNLSRNLSLSGGLLYNDAHFNKGFLVPCATGQCEALRQLPFAPKWKATISGEYHHSLFAKVDGVAQFDFSYSDKFNYGSSPGNPASPARYLLGLRTGLRTSDGRFGIFVFCRNCLDKRYPIITTFDGFGAYDGSALPAVPGGPAPVGAATVQYLSADSYRVLGLTLDARF
jgi:iron complex outermembrane receptor protein